jgi:hypothetical protein
MKNIKNSNNYLSLILKSFNILISGVFHLIIILYPLQFLSPEEDLILPTVEEDSLEIQLMDHQPDTKFLKVLNDVEKENTINNSNILSNETINSKKTLYGGITSDVIKNKKIEDSGDYVPKETDYLTKTMSEAEGEITDISTVKFKYFNYYTDLKDSVEEKWRVKISEYFKDIVLDNNKTIKTILVLKIDKLGFVKNVDVGESSGSPELDKIAISVFRGYQLQSPPKDIFNNKEFIYLYWGFALKI